MAITAATAVPRVLTTILTVLAFIFAVVTTTSKDWAWQDQLSDAIVDPSVIGRIHRSPFIKCSLGHDLNNGTDSFPEICTHFAVTGAGRTSCEVSQGGNEHLCQQVHMAGGLCVAACVLLGLALLLCLALLIAGLVLSSSKPAAASPSPSWTGWVNLVNLLFLLTGALTLALAQLVGVNALANSQRPNGDYLVFGNDPSSVRPWVIGQAGLVYASVGWFAALLALAGSGLVWRVPRVVNEVDNGAPGAAGAAPVHGSGYRTGGDEGGKRQDGGGVVIEHSRAV